MSWQNSKICIKISAIAKQIFVTTALFILKFVRNFKQNFTHNFACLKKSRKKNPTQNIELNQTLNSTQSQASNFKRNSTQNPASNSAPNFSATSATPDLAQNSNSVLAQSQGQNFASKISIRNFTQALVLAFSTAKENFISRALPISLRVTLYYSVFILALAGAIIGICGYILDEVSGSSVSQKKLAHLVQKAARDDKLKSFDDGVFFYEHDGQSGVIAGFVPKGFDPALPLSPQGAREVELDDNEFFYYDAQIKGRSAWIRGVIAVSEFELAMKRVMLIALILSPLFVVLVIYGGYAIIKRAFKPVRTMSRTASEIGASGDFTRRIELPRGKDELSALAATFNEMLASLQSAFERERQLSADLSHELRTPVAVILAQSDYALAYEQDASEAKESFAVINNQARKISALIEQILELARLQRSVCLGLAPVSLSRIASECAQDFQLLCAQKGLSFSSQIAEGARVNGDELLLIRLINNLLSNALKFTRSSVALELCVSADACELSISDDGEGIEPALQTKIWDKLYQIERSRNREQNSGAGLGLAIASQIAKIHNAQVSLRSKVGRGSKFSVKFKKV